MFADDASLYTIVTNFKQVNDNFQNNVTNVQEWYTNNKLAVNAPKTKVMLVTNKNAPTNDQKLSITLNGHTLEQVKSMHYPGVDGDENLTWEVHVKSLIRVLSYKLFTLNKASK